MDTVPTPVKIVTNYFKIWAQDVVEFYLFDARSEIDTRLVFETASRRLRQLTTDSKSAQLSIWQPSVFVGIWNVAPIIGQIPDNHAWIPEVQTQHGAIAEFVTSAGGDA